MTTRTNTGTEPAPCAAEGDAPAVFVVNYENLKQYSGVWRKIRAYAEDSAGKKYWSKQVERAHVPSWAVRED